MPRPERSLSIVAYRVPAGNGSAEADAEEIAAFARQQETKARRVAITVGAIVFTGSALFFVAGLFVKRDRPALHCTKVLVTYESEVGAPYKPPGSWSYCER
jgi:hypothetical protein